MARVDKISPYVDVEIAGSMMKNSKSFSEKGSDIDSESQPFLDGPRSEKQAIVSVKGGPWKLTAMGLAGLNVLLLVLLFFRNKELEVLPAGSRTAVASDFPGARGFIELQDVTFTGNTAFYENGTGYIPHPSLIQYFGDPSKEVDKRWEELAGCKIPFDGSDTGNWNKADIQDLARDFLISEAEAKELWPNDYHVHWDAKVNGYPIGLDMFHTLHCINDLRKLFHPNYYPVTMLNEASQAKHRDHCLDQLRQYVMCAGDMTPYGTRYYSGIGYNYADSDVTHTCRNFDKLRAWTTKRYHAGGDLHLPGVEVWE